MLCVVILIHPADDFDLTCWFAIFIKGRNVKITLFNIADKVIDHIVLIGKEMFSGNSVYRRSFEQLSNLMGLFSL